MAPHAQNPSRKDCRYFAAPLFWRHLGWVVEMCVHSALRSPTCLSYGRRAECLIAYLLPTRKATKPTARVENFHADGALERISHGYRSRDREWDFFGPRCCISEVAKFRGLHC
jgi:hypothetical protein